MTLVVLIWMIPKGVLLKKRVPKRERIPKRESLPKREKQQKREKVANNHFFYLNINSHTKLQFSINLINWHKD